MGRIPLRCWALGLAAGVLEVLPFPIAGPTPMWRTAFAWFALAPLLAAVLFGRGGQPLGPGEAAAVAFPSGILWYAGSCYWIYETMAKYGNMPAYAAALILLAFAIAGSLYQMSFAVAVVWVARRSGRLWLGLTLAPFFWVAQEYGRSHINQFPWDHLGVAQISNRFLMLLPPVTGDYGPSFVLAGASAALVGGMYLARGRRRVAAVCGMLAMIAALQYGCYLLPPRQETEAVANLLQINLNVGSETGTAGGGEEQWAGPAYDRTMAELTRMSEQGCTPFHPGMPSTPPVEPDCARAPQRPNLIVWPESPAPLEEGDPRFQHWLSALAMDAQAPVIVQNDATTANPGDPRGYDLFNSVSFIAPDGRFSGRYDKIHLVPFGEYVPYREFFSFAGKLTREVGSFSRGTTRNVFAVDGHRYGTFICYESTFGPEIRQFVLNGADALVNSSDDGWYGDSAAPWQHLDMVRMRAIENRRWVLRSTNTGITAAIDPYGRVTQSATRHVRTSLAASFGYRTDLTIYTRFGDVFAVLCVIISLAALGAATAMKPQMQAHAAMEARV